MTRIGRLVLAAALVGAAAAACGLSTIGTGAALGDDGGPGSDAMDGFLDGASNAADGSAASLDAAAATDAIVDASGCGADLEASATNCGACGHSCLGAACVGGFCEPSLVLTYTPGVRSVATNSTRLYFSNDLSGVIGWVPLSNLSASPTFILTGLGLPCELAVTDADLYWVSCTSNQVFHATADGQNNTPVVNNVVGCIFLGPGGEGYVPNYGENFLLRFNLATPATTAVLLDGSSNVLLPWGIAATTTDIYWTNSENDGGVFHRPFAGGKTVTIATNQGNANCISFADGFVYWPDHNSGEVHRARADGTGEQILARGLVKPTTIAFDPSYMYWNTNDTIMRVAR